jgi:nitrate/TMAO reductase-like tetraheme cytochrome c subunit
MGDYYAAWQKGSHRAVATCNSCHTPHNLVGKYTTKALNGFWHSFYFTTGRYPTRSASRHATGRSPNARAATATRRSRPPSRRGAHVVAAAPHDAAARDDAWRTGDGRTEAASGAATEAEDRSASCVRCHAAVGHWVR